jgi:hypothetical protein
LVGSGKRAYLEDSGDNQQDREYDSEGDPGQKTTKEEGEKEQ